MTYEMQVADTLPAPPCPGHEFSQDGFTCSRCGEDMTTYVSGESVLCAIAEKETE